MNIDPYILDAIEAETGGDMAPDSSRTFRPVFLAQRVSLWPVILVALLSTAACATMIAYFVASAIRG